MWLPVKSARELHQFISWYLKYFEKRDLLLQSARKLAKEDKMYGALSLLMQNHSVLFILLARRRCDDGTDFCLAFDDLNEVLSLQDVTTIFVWDSLVTKVVLF